MFQQGNLSYYLQIILSYHVHAQPAFSSPFGSWVLSADTVVEDIVKIVIIVVIIDIIRIKVVLVFINLKDLSIFMHSVF